MTESVGYKRPPAHGRFRPGRSGNPTGRPKRPPSFRAALLKELAETTRTNGQKRASKLEALVKTLVDSAVAGDARAQSILVGVLARIGEAENNEAASLPSDDQAILDAYVGDKLKRRGAETDAAAPAPGEDKAD
jgi:hypothetical protein